MELDSDRAHNFGLVPIPWTSIANYARAFEFDQEQTEDLLYLIRRIDNDHLAKLESKAKK